MNRLIEWIRRIPLYLRFVIIAVLAAVVTSQTHAGIPEVALVGGVAALLYVLKRELTRKPRSRRPEADAML